MYLWGSEVSCCSLAAFCFGELLLGAFVLFVWFVRDRMFTVLKIAK